VPCPWLPAFQRKATPAPKATISASLARAVDSLPGDRSSSGGRQAHQRAAAGGPPNRIAIAGARQAAGEGHAALEGHGAAGAQGEGAARLRALRRPAGAGIEPPQLALAAGAGLGREEQPIADAPEFPGLRTGRGLHEDVGQRRGALGVDAPGLEAGLGVIEGEQQPVLGRGVERKGLAGLQGRHGAAGGGARHEVLQQGRARRSAVAAHQLAADPGQLGEAVEAAGIDAEVARRGARAARQQVDEQARAGERAVADRQLLTQVALGRLLDLCTEIELAAEEDSRGRARIAEGQVGVGQQRGAARGAVGAVELVLSPGPAEHRQEGPAAI
jgi:hypothetical protein